MAHVEWWLVEFHGSNGRSDGPPNSTVEICLRITTSSSRKSDYRPETFSGSRHRGRSTRRKGEFPSLPASPIFRAGHEI